MNMTQPKKGHFLYLRQQVPEDHHVVKKATGGVAQLLTAAKKKNVTSLLQNKKYNF